MPTTDNTNSSDKDIKGVFSYITIEENNYNTARVPLTSSKDWNMKEHIERCTNVANAWYHQGKNDGMRPYDDIVTPIINVAMRSEGFDVKDIIPFVDDVNESYKSFLIKKFHPQWARKNELDTFIDDCVETSIIYDLLLVKNINNVKPEVIDLKTIAFCDQTDVMAGSICLKHNYTPSELVEFKGKWDSDMIDQAIILSTESKKVSIAQNQTVKTPSKYIEVYELRGNLPEIWLDEQGELNKYVNQMQIVCFYEDKDGKKQGITLYKGLDKPLSDNFKALKIDRIRSKGRACGRSVVESLFEPQVWRNYDAIKIKQLLDGALSIFQTDSEEYKNQKLSELKTNTVIGHETGKPITRIDGNIQNLTAFTNDQVKQENSARVIGSASDAQLGTNPVSGTPFSLQQLVVQQGQGLHEYRQGKIATFFADVLYRDWILQYLVNEMNNGKKFSEELSLDELEQVATQIAQNKADEAVKAQILTTGKVPTNQDRDVIMQGIKKQQMKKGNRGFFEVIKGELKEIPVDVMINIKSKQRNMAANADKISNLITNILKSPPGAIANTPGVAKLFNELIEESGFSPVDFADITKPAPQPAQPTPSPTPSPVQPNQLSTPPVGGGQLTASQ